jgi:hypothetical protein
VHAPDHSASITVSPTEYLRLSEFERFEGVEGWAYVATLDARVATFSCNHYLFHFHDLPEFVRDLGEAFGALRGTVSLRKIRETDRLTFRFIETTGHVVLSADLGRSYADRGGSWKFELGFDQTYLGPFLHDLEKIDRALHG